VGVKRFRDVEHLVRVAVLFAVGVLVFSIARAQFVPAGFGTLGHFRAGAIDDVRGRPIEHAGQQACAECHVDVVELRAQARHKAIACESCHGPLAKHAADPAQTKPKLPEARPLCVHCHAANTGKTKKYPTVDIKAHAGDENCISCHKPHNPKLS
jgi:uncharacterized CHY-type Zn-finger protein